ncbi:hypothetical protein NQ318_018491 [Aromia moschata]|uniref:Mos1 transposase HTH domain-containing protein n=1 Tax=Aromia moschata TaxID=1265417 RepID=A0AAV8YMP3_9CUCU|nr:hypothetical protein NQ318_018491 [Aromia moschata]
MQKSIEQRYASKFCSGSANQSMYQQVYGSDCLSKAQIFRWHKCFNDGREGFEDEDHSGRPSTSKTDENVQKVCDVLNSERRLSVRMIANEVGIDKITMPTIITKDLAMMICAKLVPKVLSDDQKQRRMELSEAASGVGLRRNRPGGGGGGGGGGERTKCRSHNRYSGGRSVPSHDFTMVTGTMVFICPMRPLTTWQRS